MVTHNMQTQAVKISRKKTRQNMILNVIFEIFKLIFLLFLLLKGLMLMSPV